MKMAEDGVGNEQSASTVMPESATKFLLEKATLTFFIPVGKSRNKWEQ
jgi:hypothetical protein